MNWNESSDEGHSEEEDGRVENKLMFRSASVIVLIRGTGQQRESEVPEHSCPSDLSPPFCTSPQGDAHPIGAKQPHASPLQEKVLYYTCIKGPKPCSGFTGDDTMVIPGVLHTMKLFFEVTWVILWYMNMIIIQFIGDQRNTLQKKKRKKKRFVCLCLYD